MRETHEYTKMVWTTTFLFYYITSCLLFASVGRYDNCHRNSNAVSNEIQPHTNEHVRKIRQWRMTIFSATRNVVHETSKKCPTPASSTITNLRAKIFISHHLMLTQHIHNIVWFRSLNEIAVQHIHANATKYILDDSYNVYDPCKEGTSTVQMKPKWSGIPLQHRSHNSQG